MKKILIGAGFILMVFITSTGCNNAGTKNAGCDTLALINTLFEKYKSDSSVSFISDPVYKKIEEFIQAQQPMRFFATNAPDQGIPVDAAKRYHQDYLSNPLPFYYRDAMGVAVRVRGFFLDRNDLTSLYTNGANGARIYFGMDQNGFYKLVCTAVTSDYGNHLVNNEIFDDFLPCPTRCPETEGTTPAAQQTDLNWDGTIHRPIKP